MHQNNQRNHLQLAFQKHHLSTPSNVLIQMDLMTRDPTMHAVECVQQF